jgi:hypothetical protein
MLVRRLLAMKVATAMARSLSERTSPPEKRYDERKGAANKPAARLRAPRMIDNLKPVPTRALAVLASPRPTLSAMNLCSTVGIANRRMRENRP